MSQKPPDSPTQKAADPQAKTSDNPAPGKGTKVIFYQDYLTTKPILNNQLLVVSGEADFRMNCYEDLFPFGEASKIQSWVKNCREPNSRTSRPEPESPWRIVEGALSVPHKHGIFLEWARRKNKSYRPCEFDKGFSASKRLIPYHVLYMPLPPATISKSIRLKQTDKKTGLIFVKFYDPETMGLCYLGHLLITITDPVGSIFPQVITMGGLDESIELIVWEEICLTRIDAIDVTRSFLDCELDTGDILIFQKALTDQQKLEHAFPLVNQYFDLYLSKTEVIEVRSQGKEAKESQPSFVDLFLLLLCGQQSNESLWSHIPREIIDHIAFVAERRRKSAYIQGFFIRGFKYDTDLVVHEISRGLGVPEKAVKLLGSTKEPLLYVLDF